jgi:tetratricopeptide (TPR) repeat protein
MSVASRIGWLMSPLALACGGYSTTTRLVDGEMLTSNPIAPQAYALYMEATLEEAAGNLETARETYIAATQFEGNNPELWTRVADLSCRLELSSADEEFEVALSEDRWYAPAWIARSRCELKHGNPKQALSFARLAQISAANDFEATEALASVYTQTGDLKAALRQWIAYTTLQPNDRRGWQRLTTSSERAHKPEWHSWAVAALGTGPHLQTALRSSVIEIPKPLVAAILREDLRAARAFATDHALSQVVVLESALELGRPKLAVEQAKVLVPAYSNSADVRALALLAAARANDDVMLELWSQTPAQLTALTERGHWALQALLRERCGMLENELVGRDVPRHSD